MKANLERMAHLIKVCGFLMQTKVYLFWKLTSEKALKQARKQKKWEVAGDISNKVTLFLEA
jgi:hypothetical protein